MNFGNGADVNPATYGAGVRAPPMEAPPPYAASRYIPTRFARNSLRPSVLIMCFFSTIWSLAAGTQYMKDRHDHSKPGSRPNAIAKTPLLLIPSPPLADVDSKLGIIYIALGAIYFAIAAIEVYGFGAAYLQRLGLVRIYFYMATLAACAASAAEVLRTVIHFVDKTDIIAACVGDQMDANTPGDTITTDQAKSLCNSSWSNSIWWDIGLLIVTLVLSFFFASLAAGYLHQLSNPASMRTQTAQLAPSSAYNYPLAPYPPNPYAATAAPPYQPGGLPTYDGYAEGFGPGTKEKEEVNPFAEATTPNTPGFNLGQREEARESTDQVTFEPRREAEGRV